MQRAASDVEAAAAGGLWEWALNVGPAALTDAHAILRNAGFGVLSRCALGSKTCDAGFTGLYPQSTMQFVALWPEGKASGPGLYVGAHDAAPAINAIGLVPNAGGAPRAIDISMTRNDTIAAGQRSTYVTFLALRNTTTAAPPAAA